MLGVPPPKNKVFNWAPPDSGFLSFPRYDLEMNSWELCERLLESPYRTYLVPGICYHIEKHVRLGYGDREADEIERGLMKIDEFLQSL